MTILQIPYAYTSNKIPISPEMAEKGQDFSCPICDNEVVLKRGKVRRPILPINQIPDVLAKRFAIKSQNR